MTELWPSDAVPSLKLLSDLDSFVRLDPGASGFVGTVALGIRVGTRDYWWWAVSDGGRTRTGHGEAPPENTEAALLLGDYEAECILDGSSLPNDADLIATGDVSSLQRLFDRYLGKQTMLDLRASRASPSGAQR